jgi:hypothetical protein
VASLLVALASASSAPASPATDAPMPRTNPIADLTLHGSVGARVQAGQRVTSELVVRNNGPATAAEVKIEMELSGPGEIRWVETDDDVDCKVRSAWLSCALHSLAPGERVVVLVRVKSRRAGLILNGAAVYGQQSDPGDNNAVLLRTRASARR